jgi:hypothetical protein
VARRASTYFIIGTLSPEADCLAFNPGELPLGKSGWVLDICYTLVTLWNPRSRQPFASIKSSAREQLGLLVDLYSFHSNRLLAVKLLNWVEARDVSAKQNMIGAFLGTEAIKVSSNRKNEQNRRWRKVAKVFPYVVNQPHLRLAVKDYVAALRDEGDDAMLFAYRAVEDVCRSLRPIAGQFTSADWQHMHTTIGTRKDVLDPLIKVAKQVRHGNVTNKAVSAARRRRTKLLAVSRETILRRFEYSHAWFIRGAEKATI